MLRERLDRVVERCREVAPELLDDLARIREALDGEVAWTLAPDLFAGPVAGSEPERQPEEPDRYEVLDAIARGGMGEVYRVHDTRLKRVLAMKRISAHLAEHPAVLGRFIEEAQATAQLQHPGIVPVHDLGTLPDGRAFFTMMEIKGRTFTQAITEAHDDASDWLPALRRLVSILHRASQAVGFAHQRGAVHRDLKPDNIMLGDFGEVYVVDWGLVKVKGASATELPESVSTSRSESDAHTTRMGTVAGTPAYMAPEQALGQVDRIDARTDVYALGAILYEVLSGRRPYEGRDSQTVLEQVRAGPPNGLSDRSTSVEDAAHVGVDRLPSDLVRACDRAMARDPADRFARAIDFAAALQDWLDGARRREQAQAVVALAATTVPQAERLRAEAEAAAQASKELLAGVPSWAPERDKRAGWEAAERAVELRRRAELKEVEREQLLHAAVTHAPDLAEGHAALAETWLERHRAAEVRRDPVGEAKAEALLRQHAEALPEGHEVRAVVTAYLEGRGTLSLVTDPPGAVVRVERYVPALRRLVLEPVGELGPTPITRVDLPRGSYRCTLLHPDCEPVVYPVFIGRREHWHGVRPGADTPHPIHLPPRGALAEGECYVPAGWFQAGGHLDNALPAGTSLWCDGFVMRRFPETNRAYVAFLNDLVDRGREEDALRWAPRMPAGRHGEVGSLIYAREPEAPHHFVLAPDADGDAWHPDYPVLMIDAFGAAAFAAWEAERTGLPWRLPGELEWEKAARGVDGRRFPWGDQFDASYTATRGSRQGRPLPQVVDSFPVDVSPYGVRGMAGNAQDWCADGLVPAEELARRPIVEVGDGGDGPLRTHRGGFWSGGNEPALTFRRFYNAPTVRFQTVSVRLVRSV